VSRRPSVQAAAEGQFDSRLDAGRDCPLCPRLVAFREAARAAEPEWHNAPVASFGSLSARLLVVGLAPGLRGANRTGRPFTGDFAGELLYTTLTDFGFAQGTYAQRPDDGLTLVDCLISNAVRCVPPENKPSPLEIRTCRTFLEATLAAMPNLRAIVALGRIAHESVARAVGTVPARLPFGHGREFALPPKFQAEPRLFDSYHCSRYNTNTGVLTPQMFRAVFARVRDVLDSA
jgi:uracil-DNA glycosylase family 4